MSEFPRMLYRPGDSLEIWGRRVDTMIVDSADEERAAIDQGWLRRPDQHPLDHDGDGKPGGSIKRRTLKVKTDGVAQSEEVLG